MTETTKTTIFATVSALFYHDCIHDTEDHDCLGCPFRSHYIDNPIDDELDGVYYDGLCDKHGLYHGCAKWMHEMGDNL